MPIKIFKIEQNNITVTQNDLNKWKYFNRLIKDQLKQIAYHNIENDRLINYKINLEDITHVFIEKNKVFEGVLLSGLTKSNYGSYLDWYYILNTKETTIVIDSIQDLLYPIIKNYQYNLISEGVEPVIDTLYPKSLVLNHNDLIKSNIKQFDYSNSNFYLNSDKYNQSDSQLSMVELII